MELTGMELHTLGIILLIVVAIDALTCHFLTTEHIVDHYCLVVVLQTTLVQSQFLIGDITGRDESVAEIRIDAVSGNSDMERFIPPPFLIEPDKHFDIDILTNSLVDQFAPIIHLRLYGLTTTHPLVVAYREAGHYLIAGVLEFEGQRGDIDWYRHVHIIRIDSGCLFDVGELGWNRGGLTGGQKEEGRCKKEDV
jgi:hypothetical protein